jgi:putative hydrolase of HD superfamily
MTDDLHSLGAFLYEMGYLKRVPRAGWHIAGVPDPESIADHSFRTAVIGMLLAHLEGADPGRTTMLALMHDTQESRTGDVPSVGKAYVQTVDPVTVTGDQTEGFPAAIRAAMVGLVGEYEARHTLEARCALDADKLELLLQAREYQAAGNLDVQPWIDTAVAALRTETGRRLAALCQEMPPRAWWRAAAAEYPARPRAVSG